jgi:hypothetical protein
MKIIFARIGIILTALFMFIFILTLFASALYYKEAILYETIIWRIELVSIFIVFISVLSNHIFDWMCESNW